MNPIEQIEKDQLRTDLPAFKPGDRVRVHVRIREGEKERIQVFEGDVIALKGASNRETVTVRKVSYGVGVERVFPLHSPHVHKIEVVTFGKVRRAKLYYLRKLRGKAARIKEDVEARYAMAAKAKAEAKAKAKAKATTTDAPAPEPESETPTDDAPAAEDG